MSGMTPPEVDPLDFNQIFSGLQQDQHSKRTQSNGSSFGGYYDHSTPDQGQAGRQGQRHRSSSSLSQGYQQSSEESRQNSFPIEQSTLLATGNHGRRLSGVDLRQQQESGPSAFMGFGNANGGQPLYSDPVEQYLNQNYENYDNTNGTPFQQTQSHVQQQYHTPYQSSDNSNNFASTSTAHQMSTPNWGDQFLQDSNHFQDTNQVQGGNQYDSQSGNYNGESSGQGGLGESSFDANLAELIRSTHASRSNTPQPEENQRSQSRSVSPNPFPANQYTSSRSNSPFMKPTSPPALIIPGGGAPSPAPHLPPIITNPTSQPPPPSVGNQPAPANSGGLFPPANPALTGMAGISPIHPNADGPMIFVQPSTPISGLNGARGVWENALRQAAETRQSQSGKAGSSNGQPQGLSRGNSDQDTRHGDQGQGQGNLDPPISPMRPRAKSDSHMAEFDRQILMQMMAQQQALLHQQQQQLQGQVPAPQQGEVYSNMNIDAWRAMVNSSELPPTLDPRQIPGQQHDQFSQNSQQAQFPIDATAMFQQMQQQHQYSQLQAQAHALKSRLAPLNTAPDLSNFPPQPTGFSPTSMAFYQSLGINPLSANQLAGTSSAPFYTTSFQNIPQNYMVPPPAGFDPQAMLGVGPDMGPRRRSYAEGMGGTGHHASGAGTPGYGVGLSPNQGRPVMGHRRGIQSEDFGRGWGLGQAGSTSDFLQSITANDGSLLPPSRGRSHSRHSSASSARSASPALSISSQGSSMSHNSPRMGMPDEQEVVGGKARSKMPRMKVTSMATEMASSARRTNDGVFVCPIPGCGSTFTRHFNLKGHLRSHNDERPYKCLYDGCPKSIMGFARQHDCKRHMLLHEGLRPFECEGCGKKFARLDALTRHHKSEQGQECAITHPLPLNPDGSPMSESQYKAFKGISDDVKPNEGGKPKKKGGGGGGVKVKQELEDYSLSDLGEEGGMSEYDVAA